MNGKKDTLVNVRTNKNIIEDNGNSSSKPIRNGNNSGYSTPRTNIKVSRIRNPSGSNFWTPSSKRNGYYTANNWEKYNRSYGNTDNEIGKLKSESKSELSRHITYEKNIRVIKARINKLALEESKTKSDLLRKQEINKRDKEIINDKKSRLDSIEKVKKEKENIIKKKKINSKKMKDEMEKNMNKMKKRNMSAKTNNAKMATEYRKQLEKAVQEAKMKELERKKKNCENVKTYFTMSNEKMRKNDLKKKEIFKKKLKKEIASQSMENKELERSIEEHEEIKNNLQEKINRLGSSREYKNGK